MRSDKIVNIESCLRKQNKKIAMIRHINIKLKTNSTFDMHIKKPRTKLCTYCNFNLYSSKLKTLWQIKSFIQNQGNARVFLIFFFLINVYYHFRITIFFPSLIFSNIFLVTGNNLRSRIENVRCPVLSCGTYSGQTSNF